MNPHLLNITIGLAFILVFGGMSLLRREGLSLQFALEVLGLTAVIEGLSLARGTTVNPVLFLAIIYLVSMRVRLLVDLANLVSSTGRQGDALRLLRFAEHLLADRSSKLVAWVNMGIVQLRRKNPASAESLFKSVLQEAEQGGLGIKYEAACRYNLGLALMRQGKEAEAVHQLNQAIDTFPSSIYGKAAQRALEQRRHGRKKPQDRS